MTPDTPVEAAYAQPLTAQRRTQHTCGGCDNTWTALTAAHCPTCHRTFSAIRHFDTHRSQDGPRGHCIDPDTIHNRRGERLLWFRDGMWRGPAMPAELLARHQATTTPT